MTSKSTHRTLGVVIFGAAIALGMQIATYSSRAIGQTELPPEISSVIPKSGGGGGGVGSAPPAAEAPSAPPAAGSGGGAARGTFVPRNTNDELKKVLEAADQEASGERPKPKPQQPEVFVPSVVETYIPQPVRIADPRAILFTSMGQVTIKLYPSTAPQNVKNFIELARGEREYLDAKTSKKTRRPFYNNLTFHRALPDFMVQTGCQRGDGRGWPGYTVKDEFHPSRSFDKPGIVAMAPQREGTKFAKDTNGSQFFITVRAAPEWDGKFTIIGEVERGLDVIRKISKVKTGPTDRPIRRVFLNKIEILDETTAGALGDDDDDDEDFPLKSQDDL